MDPIIAIETIELQQIKDTIKQESRGKKSNSKVETCFTSTINKDVRAEVPISAQGQLKMASVTMTSEDVMQGSLI